MSNLVVGVVSTEEVLALLQDDAIEIHRRHVYAINNLATDNIGDQVRSILSYESVLGKIEEQINSLFQ